MGRSLFIKFVKYFRHHFHSLNVVRIFITMIQRKKCAIHIGSPFEMAWWVREKEKHEYDGTAEGKKMSGLSSTLTRFHSIIWAHSFRMSWWMTPAIKLCVCVYFTIASVFYLIKNKGINDQRDSWSVPNHPTEWLEKRAKKSGFNARESKMCTIYAQSLTHCEKGSQNWNIQIVADRCWLWSECKREKEGEILLYVIIQRMNEGRCISNGSSCMQTGQLIFMKFINHPKKNIKKTNTYTQRERREKRILTWSKIISKMIWFHRRATQQPIWHIKCVLRCHPPIDRSSKHCILFNMLSKRHIKNPTIQRERKKSQPLPSRLSVEALAMRWISFQLNQIKEIRADFPYVICFGFYVKEREKLMTTQ